MIDFTSPEPSQGMHSEPPRHVVPSRIRQLFCAVAPRYDLLNHLLSFGIDIGWRRATVRALRAVLQQSGALIVDLCCGTGDLTFALARRARAQVVGTDFCHPMLRLARSKARRTASQVGLVESDVLRLPFLDESVDAVSIAFGFRNLADYAAGLREMHRVLKPGGKVAILEFSQVRTPLFGTLFRVYFRFVLPRLGGWISGVAGAYRYLHDSVSTFPDQETLAAALRVAGFSNVCYRNLTGGIAALHVGEKG